jgi:hypothetical protein
MAHIHMIPISEMVMGLTINNVHLLPACWDWQTAFYPINKNIDSFANFPARLSDFLIGNNSQCCANNSKFASNYTRPVYQYCGGFVLGADGKQRYSPSNASWGKAFAVSLSIFYTQALCGLT